MLLTTYSEQNNKIAVKNYIDSFLSFLQKCPIIFDKIERIENSFYIYLKNDVNPIVYRVRFDLNKHKQINELKNILLSSYPVIQEPIETLISTKERDKLLEEGVSLD